MQAAVIVMSILGCNEQVQDCTHLATVQKRYASMELCEVAAEAILERNASYQVASLAAVCETPDVYDAQGPGHGGELTARNGRIAAHRLLVEPEKGLAERALAAVQNTLPSLDTIKSTLEKPGEVISDTYGWVTRQFK